MRITYLTGIKHLPDVARTELGNTHGPGVRPQPGLNGLLVSKDRDEPLAEAHEARSTCPPS